MPTPAPTPVPDPTPSTPDPIVVGIPPPQKPIYQGPAIQHVVVQIRRDRSQELCTVASIMVERDADGTSKQVAMGGGTGHETIDYPSEWKSISVSVNNPGILSGPFTEPVVASPPSPWVAGPVPTDKVPQITILFNYTSVTQSTEIETTRGTMEKFTQQDKTTISGNLTVGLGAEILGELAAKLGIGDGKVAVKVTPNISAGGLAPCHGSSTHRIPAAERP
jgi:hypothetical protein